MATHKEGDMCLGICGSRSSSSRPNVYDVNDLSIKKDKHWEVKNMEIFHQSKQHSR